MFPFTETIVRAAKVRPCAATPIGNEPKPKDSQATTNCNLTKLEVLDVHLIDEFQEALEVVQSHAEPLLSRLKESGVVPVGQDLSALTPDFTRFLVKQAEMTVSSTEKDDTEEKQSYVMVVCLHALVTAGDLLLHCSLTAAIGEL